MIYTCINSIHVAPFLFKASFKIKIIVSKYKAVHLIEMFENKMKSLRTIYRWKKQMKPWTRITVLAHTFSLATNNITGILKSLVKLLIIQLSISIVSF